MSDAFIKWAVGVATALTIAIVAALASMWNTVNRLENWHMEQWPLERQIIYIDVTQFQAQMDVMNSKIDELVDQVSDLEYELNRARLQ